MGDTNKTIKTLPKAKKTKNLAKSKKTKVTNKAFETDFLTPSAKTASLHLQKTFIKVLILHLFDPERHIQIKNDASGYAIEEIFSHLTLDQKFSVYMISENLNFFKSSQWYLMVFFSQKMILVETYYNTYN